MSESPDIKTIIEMYREAGESEEAITLWLTSPSPWLDGRIPCEELIVNPQRVFDVTRSRIENASV